jgi:UDP-N-acetylglucosamine 1-carboxyvinyltransferase
MEKYIINGGRKLIGEIEISPAKNACLPIIASAIIFNGKVLLKNAPNILDVMVMAEIISIAINESTGEV